MSEALARLSHLLFRDCAAFFVNPTQFQRPQFDSLVQVLQSKAEVDLNSTRRELYWRALEERLKGNARWDTICPFVPLSQDIQSQKIHRSSQFAVANILRERPHVGFTVEQICYVIEVFNPRDELGLEYAGAGEPIVALLLKETQFGAVQYRLTENTSFYSIIKDFAEVLEPETVVGMNGANLGTLMFAYQEGRLTRKVRPWSFLFPLHVRPLPKPVGDVTLRRYFRHFEQWKDGRYLLQVRNGLDAMLGREYTDAAAILGMTAVQDLNPDAPKRTASSCS